MIYECLLIKNGKVIDTCRKIAMELVEDGFSVQMDNEEEFRNGCELIVKIIPKKY